MGFLKAKSGNQSDSLWVNWERGDGDLSGYQLYLYNPNGSQQAMHQLGSEATGFIFSGLIAGRLYRAEVLSQSGGLSNRASTLSRTGKMQLLLALSRDETMAQITSVYHLDIQSAVSVVFQ